MVVSRKFEKWRRGLASSGLQETQHRILVFPVRKSHDVNETWVRAPCEVSQIPSCFENIRRLQLTMSKNRPAGAPSPTRSRPEGDCLRRRDGWPGHARPLTRRASQDLMRFRLGDEASVRSRTAFSDAPGSGQATSLDHWFSSPAISGPDVPGPPRCRPRLYENHTAAGPFQTQSSRATNPEMKLSRSAASESHDRIHCITICHHQTPGLARNMSAATRLSLLHAPTSLRQCWSRIEDPHDLFSHRVGPPAVVMACDGAAQILSNIFASCSNLIDRELLALGSVTMAASCPTSPAGLG